MRPTRTTREQRADWLLSINITEASFNRSVKSMLDKDISREAKMKMHKTKAKYSQ